jgi:hypothetical protein
MFAGAGLQVPSGQCLPSKAPHLLPSRRRAPFTPTLSYQPPKQVIVHDVYLPGKTGDWKM